MTNTKQENPLLDLAAAVEEYQATRDKRGNQDKAILARFRMMQRLQDPATPALLRQAAADRELREGLEAMPDDYTLRANDALDADAKPVRIYTLFDEKQEIRAMKFTPDEALREQPEVRK